MPYKSIPSQHFHNNGQPLKTISAMLTVAESKGREQRILNKPLLLLAMPYKSIPNQHFHKIGQTLKTISALLTGIESKGREQRILNKPLLLLVMPYKSLLRKTSLSTV